MKRFAYPTLTVLLFFLASLACNIPQISQSTPLPSATPTATITPTPITIPPTDTPIAGNPSQATSTPIPVLTPSPYQPAGYYVVPAGGGSLWIYDLNHQIIAQLAAPGLSGDNPSFAHLSGRLTGGPQNFSAVYFSWETFSLNISDLNGTNSLLSTQNFYMLAGLPAHPYIAYVNLEYADAGLLSYLTIGDFSSLPNAPVIMTVLDTDSYAVRPLAVASELENPIGVYYTSVPYGIGGDIVFEPRRSLSYLDINSFQSHQILDIGSSPAGLSPDLTWLAFTPLHPGPLAISPINDQGNPISIPLLSDSDRGAGAAVFSPGNEYVAWKEGSGWLMSETPNFHATIRIATTGGAITAEIPDAAVAAVIGNPSNIWIEPVGWLDGDTLLLEARGDVWEQATILQVNADGSFLEIIATGGFMGFIYP